MKPFLKWAGGKYRVLDTILPYFSKGNRYIEPFVGSGAVALNTDYEKYLLSDINPDLINLYNVAIHENGKFVDSLKNIFVPKNNQEKTYYAFRNTFNTTKDPFKKAVLFVYLNRHGFNGLCRYNRSGGFNVPLGKYRNPYIPIKEVMDFVEKLKNAEFVCQDFEKTMAQAGRGDIMYCDPPYIPLSITSSFANYAKDGFGLEQQEKLAQCAKDAQKRGAKVYISNHDTPLARDLYKESKIVSFPVKRVISASATNRRYVNEVLAIYE